MRRKVDEKSQAQGFPASRLPTFTDEERAMIAGSADFLGVNFYTSKMVYHEEADIADVSYEADQDLVLYKDPAWYEGGSSWLRVTPWGLRSAIAWIRDEYPPVEVYITENGFSDRLGNIDDLHRVYYYKHYINQLLKAVVLDGTPVKGYYAWSILDNFEWDRGFTEKFGLISVNFTDEGRARTVKHSGIYYSQVVKENGFV